MNEGVRVAQRGRLQHEGKRGGFKSVMEWQGPSVQMIMRWVRGQGAAKRKIKSK